MADDESPRPPYSSVEFWMAGLGEEGAAFEPPPSAPDGDARRAVYRAVLTAYDHHCAMTGARYAPVDGLHPDLMVTAIRPLSDGGRLHTDNFIALSRSADEAFALGHIAVWPDFRLVADVSTIDPELLVALNPDGRLRLPEGSPPDADALRWHREAIFASRMQSG